ncbi:MAG: hypothetical protein ACJ72R_03125 [Nitrososphaeraceae archaeon]
MSAINVNETLNKNKHTKPNKNAMFMFLILIIGISVLSLSISTIMVSAQTSSDGISGSRTDVAQMGICVVGAKSPCNGPSN